MEDLEEAPRIERCVNLNTDFLTGRPDAYYHWAIKHSGDGSYKVVDFFADRTITTQEWQEKKSVVEY